MPEHSSINELINDLVQPDEVDRFANPVEARKKAMDYLARREHSRDELYRKMEKAGFEPNVALDAIDQLQKDGLQSDRRFVDAFIQARIGQGKGPVRIRAELSQRGIREAMIQEVLGEGYYNAFTEYPHLEARLRQKVKPEEGQLVLNALVRRNHLDAADRVTLYGKMADYFRELVAFPEEAVIGMTDEQYLRNVASTVFRESVGDS